MEGACSTPPSPRDEFLSDDRLIVYTDGRAFPREDRVADTPGRF